MSRRGLQLALAATLIGIAGPGAAFDNISQQGQGVTFYIALPLEARLPKQEAFSAGLMVQGKRQEQSFYVDSTLFNHFLGSGLEAKWIIAGVVAAGAAVAVASKGKSPSPTQEQSASTPTRTTTTTTQGGSFHPDGTPHVPGDNCACHQ